MSRGGGGGGGLSVNLNVQQQIALSRLLTYDDTLCAGPVQDNRLVGTC